jgi:high affinity Mn2+ porin
LTDEDSVAIGITQLRFGADSGKLLQVSNRKNISATADYQYVINPAYNKDRGPVSILGMRLHWEF